MKIISLKASNVQRLVAVEITPDGKSVTIGGRNDQGKSSVLDAIAMALGGAKLAPPEPIRRGADEATIEVDLGDYLVTRKFRRVTKDICGPFKDDEPHAHTEDCHVYTGEVTSTLTVASKPKGDEPAARFSSPQQLLDKIMGAMAFDPMKFVTAHGTDQLAILKRVVKLDTSDLDQAIKDLEAKRTQGSRDFKAVVAAFGQLVPRHKDAPSVPIPVEQVGQELAEAAELRDIANAASEAMGTEKRALDGAHVMRQSLERAIVELERELGDKRALLQVEETRIRSLDATVTAAQTAYGEALSRVPDIAFTQRRLKEIEDLNRKYEHNVKFDLVETQVADAAQTLNAIVDNLDAARAARETRIAQAKFPVDGLAFGENGVLYNGLPFEQASTAVKLRTSVAIGLALNPTVKVLLVREGAFLDEDNLALVGKMADDANAQVWIERVGTHGVSVVIEDGKVQGS